MPDRVLVEITWRRSRPDLFQLIYSHGPADLAPGGQRGAAERAELEGFIQVDTTVDLSRWVKADSW